MESVYFWTDLPTFKVLLVVEEVNGNTLVWRHIRRENRLMTLNPLGYDAIKDIDELHNRHRRETDDPYIKATMKGTHGTKGRATGETDEL